MGKCETTINTLYQLGDKMYKEQWDDIKKLEDEDWRYTIALKNAIDFIKSTEVIWDKYIHKSNTVDLVKDLDALFNQ